MDPQDPAPPVAKKPKKEWKDLSPKEKKGAFMGLGLLVILGSLLVVALIDGDGDDTDKGSGWDWKVGNYQVDVVEVANDSPDEILLGFREVHQNETSREWPWAEALVVPARSVESLEDTRSWIFCDKEKTTHISFAVFRMDAGPPFEGTEENKTLIEWSCPGAADMTVWVDYWHGIHVTFSHIYTEEWEEENPPPHYTEEEGLPLHRLNVTVNNWGNTSLTNLDLWVNVNTHVNLTDLPGPQQYATFPLDLEAAPQYLDVKADYTDVDLPRQNYTVEGWPPPGNIQVDVREDEMVVMCVSGCTLVREW